MAPSLPLSPSSSFSRRSCVVVGPQCRRLSARHGGGVTTHHRTCAPTVAIPGHGAALWDLGGGRRRSAPGAASSSVRVRSCAPVNPRCFRTPAAHRLFLSGGGAAGSARRPQLAYLTSPRRVTRRQRRRWPIYPPPRLSPAAQKPSHQVRTDMAASPTLFVLDL
jgi:hypothetical protein